MKKTLLAALSLLIFTSCTPSQYSKNTVVKDLYHWDYVYQVNTESPELFYCFDKNQEELESDVTAISIKCFNEVFDAMPETISDAEALGYREQFGTCRKAAYFEKNSEYFSTRNVHGAKLEKCLDIKKDLVSGNFISDQLISSLLQ